MIDQPLETNDMIVVTVHVPTRLAAELSVTATADVIEIEGPDGYRHEVATPPNADVERLHAELFQDILELRAPRIDGEARRSGARAVPVRSLL